MSEFYSITTVSFQDLQFAYCEPVNPRYSDEYPRCPKCGGPIGSLFWIGNRKIKLSKPKYGDFICGNNFIVSGHFKNEYEKSNLTGIIKFIPVEITKVGYIKKTSPLPPAYYLVDLLYSFAKIDVEKSIFIGPPKDNFCALCDPFGVSSHEVRGIHIDDTNWGGEDIFHLHEMGNAVFASQNFVDFCLLNKFTNFRYINTKDYIFPSNR